MNPEAALAPARRDDPTGASGWRLRPPAAIVAQSYRWAGALLVLFVVLYGGINWLTAQRADRLQLWFAWELAIPLLPWMVWAYLSIFAAFFLPMHVLDARGIDALCRRLVVATVVSAVCFLLFPAELGFIRSDAMTASEGVFALIHALDLPHNLAPSLHVSWSFILLSTLAAASRGVLRAAFVGWLAVLVASVLLTHQHHVVDVVGGMLVALAARHAVAADGRWAGAAHRRRAGIEARMNDAQPHAHPQKGRGP